MLSTEELLDGLTDPQRQAVCHVDGPLLIIAGAGSGKTRVLTRRVAYLMSLGIPAGAILAITFTNKAAGEMKERVGHLLGKPIRDFGRLEAYQPTICTFHSLCLRVLRHYADRLGFPASFSIYDTADQQKLMKDQLKKLDFSSTNFTPSTVLGTISNAKNKLITAEQFAAGANDFYAKNVAKLYTAYQAALEAANAFDFDDLLMKTVHALRDHKDVLAELQERYAYILIDEYQDTN
ncbi:MAG: ATP-dependent helicase, partial [Phycisphaerae bacterium]